MHRVHPLSPSSPSRALGRRPTTEELLRFKRLNKNTTQIKYAIKRGKTERQRNAQKDTMKLDNTDTTTFTG